MRKEFVEHLKQQIGLHVEGEASGFSQWLNGKLTRIDDDGTMEMEFEARPEMLNPYGGLHGGMISAILDEMMGMQLFIYSEPDEVFLAINLTVDFLKAVRVGERLTAQPRLVRRGKTTATFTCALRNANGDLIGQASSNYVRVGN